MARGFTHVPVHEPETVSVIEPTTYRVGLQDVEFQKRTRVSGTIHESTADAAALIIRVHENGTYFVTDQSQEADHAPLGLVDHRFSHREPLLDDLSPLSLKELLGEKRVGDQRCPIPDIEQLIKVPVNIRADHSPATIRIPTITSPPITHMLGVNPCRLDRSRVVSVGSPPRSRRGSVEKRVAVGRLLGQKLVRILVPTIAIALVLAGTAISWLKGHRWQGLLGVMWMVFASLDVRPLEDVEEVGYERHFAGEHDRHAGRSRFAPVGCCAFYTPGSGGRFVGPQDHPQAEKSCRTDHPV